MNDELLWEKYYSIPQSEDDVTTEAGLKFLSLFWRLKAHA